MRVKKGLAVLLTAALFLFSLTGLAARAGENPFADVSDEDPYYEAVLFCYENGIINGVSETAFAPDDTLTRAMFVTMLGRVAENMGLKTSGYKAPFNDVTPGGWYDTYVGWAAAKGFVNGMSPTRFAPGEFVTREQAAVIVIRFAEKLGLKLDANAGADFSDWAVVSGWALSPMQKAAGAGLAVGASEGQLLPQRPATRAETVSMLYTLCVRYIGDLKLIEYYGEYRRADEEFPLNNYIKEHFYTSGGYKYYDDGKIRSILGIDVSHHEDVIDWARVRDAGVEFAMIRAGYRGYGVESGGVIRDDKRFEENVQGALDNGIKAGVYVFSQAISVEEALEEAAYTLARIEGYDITYPVVFDWEDIPTRARTNGISTRMLTDCAIAFCDAVAAAGYTPMIYTNKDMALNLYDLSRLSRYDFWLAEYRDVPGFYYGFTMWQYTEKGKVDGINGYVDIDISFVDYAGRAAADG